MIEAAFALSSVQVKCIAGDSNLGLLEQLSMLLRVTVAQAQQQVQHELAGVPSASDTMAQNQCWLTCIAFVCADSVLTDVPISGHEVCQQACCSGALPST